MRSEATDAGEVAIYLTADEALVLDAFLSRGSAAGDNYSTFEDQAELRVLWDLGATLESRVPAVTNRAYDRLLAAARERVRDPIG